MIINDTKYNKFRSNDNDSQRSSIKQQVVVDLRNLSDPKRMNENGFRYSSVGRAAEDLPGE